MSMHNGEMFLPLVHFLSVHISQGWGWPEPEIRIQYRSLMLKSGICVFEVSSATTRNASHWHSDIQCHSTSSSLTCCFTLSVSETFLSLSANLKWKNLLKKVVVIFFYQSSHNSWSSILLKSNDALDIK